MLRRLDVWLGKTLFHPIIIRICQAAKITQYRFCSYCWLIAFFLILARAPHTWQGWVVYTFIALLCVVQIWLIASAPQTVQERAERRGEGIGWRIFFWICLLFDLLHYVWPPKPLLSSIIGDVIILFGMYALTITTIPPLEDRKRADKKLTPARRSA